jgi:methionine synthase I (cobalamin-dependent)
MISMTMRGTAMATPSNPLSELLAEKGVLLADGATGTNLFAQGLEAGEAPELWNEFLRRHAPSPEAAPCPGSGA